MKKEAFVTSCIASMSLLVGTQRSHATSLFVNLPSTDNIFSAGQNGPVAPSGSGPGTLPYLVNVGAAGDAFQFQASGIIGQFGTVFQFGPDGWNGTSSDINSYGGISGFKSGLSLPLVGVFLSNATPAGPAPATLDFTVSGIGMNFTTLSPGLGQIFYIGDGSNAGNVTQTFYAPGGATRLFLGFADAVNFVGDGGAYSDNTGSLDVTVTEVPEPGVGTMIVLGILGLAASRKRSVS